VAKLAGLPEEVLENAKHVSEEFEEVMNGIDMEQQRKVFELSDKSAKQSVENIMQLVKSGDLEQLRGLWDELRS
jgi:DNA mismatch repair ATPase MutS